MSGNWFFQKLCSMPVGEQKTVSKLSLFLSVPFCLTSALFHSLTFLRNKSEEQEKAEEKNQVLPVAFLLIWRLSSTLNKFKDGERQERTARISAWKQQRLKRDQRQPALSSYYFFTPLLIFEKPGPMNVIKMSRSNIILKENKLPLYFFVFYSAWASSKALCSLLPWSICKARSSPGDDRFLAGDKWKLMLIISCPLNACSARFIFKFFYFFSS